MNLDKLTNILKEVLGRFHIDRETSLKIIEAFEERLNEGNNEGLIYHSCEIYIDGGSRGNPGEGASACLIYEGGKKIVAIGKFFEKTTNNEAEYNALLLALSEGLKRGYKSIKIYTDSELLKKQIRREYCIKSPNLIPLYKKAEELISRLDGFTIEYIPRERNSEADSYVNYIMNIKRNKITRYA